jgi:chromosome segregation ATPase
MADDETPDAPEADEAPEAPGGQPQDEVFDRSRAEDKIRKANAEAANLRKRLKELEPLAQKAKELEDAGRSDVEKLSAEAQGHQSRADKAEAELMRLRVAMRKGLTETQAKRLVGSSEEELEEDADDLLASFKPAQPEPEEKAEDGEPVRDPNPRRRPQERLRPGAVPDADTEPVETDPRKLAAAIRRDVF